MGLRCTSRIRWNIRSTEAAVEKIEVARVQLAVIVAVEARARPGRDGPGAELPGGEIALIHVAVAIGISERCVTRHSAAAGGLGEGDRIDVPSGAGDRVIGAEAPAELHALTGCRRRQAGFDSLPTTRRPGPGEPIPERVTERG